MTRSQHLHRRFPPPLGEVGGVGLVGVLACGHSGSQHATEGAANMDITIHDIAVARGATPDSGGGYSGDEYNSRGLPLFAGCEGCGATLAPYNAHPSYSGYIRCGDCLGDTGFSSHEEFTVWEEAQ